MKNLIKIVVALFIITTVDTSLSAQHWGIEGGYTLTGIQQSDNGTSGDFNLLSGAYLGPQLEFNLCKSLPAYSITTAALFEMRAGRYNIDWEKYGYTASRVLYYAVVPVHFTYHKVLTTNSNLLLFAGPAANVGIFGYTNEHNYLETTTENKDKSPFGDVLNKVDISFGVGAEWEYAHFGFKLNYDFPITNSAKDSDPTTYRQHNLRMGIVYNFKVRKNIAKTEKK